jgi:periplasmic protein TonB
MAVTLVVILLISAVSLYEYFSARKWQQVTSSDRNDVVFESRNQEYGAYVIRRDYDKKIIFILLGLVTVIGLAFGISKYIRSIPEEVIEEAPIDMTQFDLPAAPPEEEVPPPPLEETPPPEMEKSIAFTPPVVTDDEVDTPPVLQEDLEDTKASTQTVDVEETFDPPAEKKPVVVEVKKEVIETFVDEEPVFGGEGLKRFLVDNIKYPQIAKETGIEGKCYISFVIDKTGNISNVTVAKGIRGCPECDKEAVRVLKLSQGKWKPARINGVPVKYRYMIPVEYKLL